jgi:hypothetical protein
VRSPETYVGYERTENFASPERMARDSRKRYSLPTKLGLNQWGLSGLWNVGGENATLQSASGKIAFRFHSRDLHMVLGSVKGTESIRFKVTLNGLAPGGSHGFDSCPDGIGVID